MTTYKVDCLQNGCVEVSKDLSTLRFYRTPYVLLKTKKHGLKLPNKFIVYLLCGSTKENPNVLYVGTATGGLDNRPTSHEDKNVNWESCIFFTSTDDSLNKSTIEYLENRIRQFINDSKKYVSVTFSTSDSGSNGAESKLCNSILPTVLEVYSLLGVDIVSGYKTTLSSFIEEKDGAMVTPVSTADYSKLDLPSEMMDWLKIAHNITLGIDSSVTSGATKLYAKYSYGLIFAYWYPLKSQNRFRIYLRGDASDYNDPRVKQRDEKRHNGDCRAEFYVSCADDLKYFRIFAETAIRNMKSSR